MVSFSPSPRRMLLSCCGPALLGFSLLSLGCSALAPPLPDGYDPSAAPVGCDGKCDGLGSAGTLAVLPHAEFATLFAPGEPALGLDLSLIDEVVSARALDPQSYSDGENPFRIRYAVYNLRNTAIANALASAVDHGVDVQILIEKDQLDPRRTWNTTDEFLVSRGFELVSKHRSLTDVTRNTADLIGITGSGLMHLKSRIYEWINADGVAQRRLTTGSMNPGDLAVSNQETLHYIEDPALIDAYVAKYEAVRDDGVLTNTWNDQAAIQVLFSPDGGAQAIDHISQLIDAEQEMILLAVYSIRDIAPSSGGAGLVQRLVSAKERGVTVMLITDRKQSDGVDSNGNGKYRNDDFEEDLRLAGIPVFEVINPASQFNAMHAKYGIFGLSEPVVVTDAGNWTRAGLGNGTLAPRNDESVLFVDSNALDGGITAVRYRANFISILRNYANASNWDVFNTGGLDMGAAADELLALGNWPQVTLAVRAEAETFFGQDVFMTGEGAMLGNWRRDGLGVKLSTTAETYPTWSEDSLKLPLGSSAEFKLIKVYDGRIQWEQEGNRKVPADPSSYANSGVSPDATRLQLDISFRE